MPKHEAAKKIIPAMVGSEAFIVTFSPMTIEQIMPRLIKVGAAAEVDGRVNSANFRHKPLQAKGARIQVVSFAWNSVNENNVPNPAPAVPSVRTILLNAGEVVRRIKAEMPGARPATVLEFLHAMLA